LLMRAKSGRPASTPAQSLAVGRGRGPSSIFWTSNARVATEGKTLLRKSLGFNCNRQPGRRQARMGKGL